MNTCKNGTRLAGAVLASLMLAGCATKATTEGPDDYAVFLEGESAAAYGTAFPVGSPEEAWHNGAAALNAGDLDRALFEYIRGLRLAKEPSAEALFRIGHIHHLRENYRLADLAYRWALQREANHAGAGTGLGEVLLHKRQYAAATQQLKEVVAANSDTSWRAWNALGVLADISSNGDEAEAFYQQALVRNPQSAVIHNNLGYSRYLLGDWDGAKQALEAALQHNPNHELAWRNLGLVHARQGNYAYALQALGRSGNQAQAYNDIGFVSMMSGDYAQAMSLFDKAMRLSPSYYVTASENASNVRRLLDRRGASDF